MSITKNCKNIERSWKKSLNFRFMGFYMKVQIEYNEKSKY